MNPRPPVQSHRQSLPFHEPAFGWDTFEDFFCDFLNAQPEIVLNEAGTEIRQRVIRARPFGRKGDSQHGIDLLAEMDGGEVWEFQCKHYKDWGPTDTREAILAYKRNAPRRFLLVTREVSEACQEVAAEYQGWHLWDSREINRRFRELNSADAAPILFTHFGSGWAEEFFGISGDTPFIGGEAKFESYLNEGRRFHHRHALVGRTGLVDELDAFVRDEKLRVFILTGRGGLGKSRLLLQWSRSFNQRHPDHTLRFLSDKCTDFAPFLQSAPLPLTLVFDDAHRLNDVRHALFPELSHRNRIKLVLSLRPGPQEEIMGELFDAGLDSTEIVSAEPMRKLTSEEALELVDMGLKPEFTGCRPFLHAASRDCPLIAVIGAELINAGALTGGDLIDQKEIQRRVFDSLLDDASPVRESFGIQATNGFLRLLSLLGPLKIDNAFFAKAATFLGMEQAAQVSHLRDALDGVGLLHTTGAGTRVTPDLLSDHLAYTSCYDRYGQSRNFAEELLNHFSPEQFPKLMQHLAAAEWRALDETPDATSVVEPLWQWFRERFEGSRFHERHTQIGEWANIAYLQPERSLELAELAMSLKVAPALEDGLFGATGSKWDSYEYSLESLPRMLASIAEHHPDKLGRCFDLLWRFGRDKPADSHFQKGHPISLIGDVVTYKPRKLLAVYEAALDWFERLLSDDDWMGYLHTPGWLLGKFFEPFFEPCMEENVSAGRKFYFRTLLVPLPITAPLRDRVLGLCQKLIEKGDPLLVSQLIHVLSKGCDIVRFGMGGDEYIAAWDIERLKSLSVLEEISQTFDEPVIHFQIRRDLMRDLRYSKASPSFLDACRNIITSIPDTLEFRIARTAFGEAYDEFERDSKHEDWITKTETRWNIFVRDVADAIREKYPDATDWLAHLTALNAQWRVFKGFYPNFRHLFMALSERCPAEGIAVAERFLNEQNHQLVGNFDAVVISATKENSEIRLRLIWAATSASETLQAAAVTCCTWWRCSNDLPEEIWQILESLSTVATPSVAYRLVDFVFLNRAQYAIRDWRIITSLPFAPDDAVLAEKIAETIADLLTQSGIKPELPSIEEFLHRLELLRELEGNKLTNALGKIAKAFPVEMFLMFWRRTQARKTADFSLKSFSYDLESIGFPRIMDSIEVQTIIAEFEKQLSAGTEPEFDEVRLLRTAILSGCENPSAWLEAAVGRALTKEHLNTLRELGSLLGFDNAALAYPDFARSLLVRAREIGGDTHEVIFSGMLHVGGGRGFSAGEPDENTKGLFGAIEQMVEKYAADAELAPLFAAIQSDQRSFLPRRNYLDEYDDD